MNLKLPIPIKYNGDIFYNATIKSYTAGVMADTNKALSIYDPYKAYQVLLAGCIESIDGIDKKQEIKEIIKNMSYKTGEFLVIKILTLDEDDDGIEGMYRCPRCGENLICEKTKDYDTRDFMKDLQINYSPEIPSVCIDFANPIEIKDKAQSDNIDSVSKLEFHHPTLQEASSAYVQHGKKDSLRLQFAIYLEALEKVNDFPVEKNFKHRYGMQVLDEFGKKEGRELTEKMNNFGFVTKVQKTCRNCGKVFDTALNTSNFFASALR